METGKGIRHLEGAKMGICETIIYSYRNLLVDLLHQINWLVSIWSDSSILSIFQSIFYIRQGKQLLYVLPLVVYKVFKNAIINSYKSQIADLLFESIRKFLNELIEAFLSAF